jgi:hypothetical protein
MPSEAEMDAVKRMSESLADFNQSCMAAHEYGLTISPEAVEELHKMPEEQRVELTAWLASPKNYDSVTHPLMSLSPEKQVEKIREYAKREDVVGSLKNGDTESWIDARREARRAGRRRK